ncbi:hypothetical protein KR50_25630 [Jeotgalibacillus campisalis]|uniref:Uncharacterized protein n=1 Tax=Jeotgalibacillus campisalis TaxID=220754 RepID=A0A0C2VQY7_9BACL|nr:hypothetical protein KR50_25630 [Jeotgalibacillus campisalis]
MLVAPKRLLSLLLYPVPAGSSSDRLTSVAPKRLLALLLL